MILCCKSFQSLKLYIQLVLNSQKTYLVISPFFPSEKSFVGSYIFDQINEIRNQTDFTIEVIKVVSFFSTEKDYEYKGFKVKIFKVLDLPFFIFPGLFNSINKKRFLQLLKSHYISEIDFTHAHVSYPASYLIEDLKCKKIVQHHGLDVLQLMNGRCNFIKNIQKRYLVKNTLRRINAIDLNVGVSQLVLDQLKEFHNYSPKDEYVLYNGVDTSKFFYKEVKKNEVFTIGCIANFWAIKDQITLIKSVQILLSKGEKVLLRLIGTGPKLDECYNYVKEHHLDDIIIFEREKEHSELNIFYNEIDLFVLPSYFEALGCVYLESWATNTPFIGVERQGISELLPDNKKSIFLAKAQDPISLQIRISHVMRTNETIVFDNNYNIENLINNFLVHLICDKEKVQHLDKI